MPERAGEPYAYFRNTGLQNQAVLYVTRDLAEPGRVLLDPNMFSPDGTVALTGSVVQRRRHAARVQHLGIGFRLAGVARARRRVGRGSAGPRALVEVFGRRLEAGWQRVLLQPLRRAGLGEQVQGRELLSQSVLHRLGTPQSTDLLSTSGSTARTGTSPHATEDGRYLVIDASRGSAPENAIFVKDLSVDGPSPAIPDGDARYQYLGNDGTTFFFLTTKDAARSRIVALDLRERSLREVVPETGDRLDSASLFGDRIIASYLRDAHAEVVVYSIAGRCSNVALPGLAACRLRRETRGRETFFSVHELYRTDGHLPV